MKNFLVALCLFALATVCGAQTLSVMCDTNGAIVYPTNGFSAITLGGATITQWQSPTSGISQATADQLYVKLNGSNVMTTSGFWQATADQLYVKLNGSNVMTGCLIAPGITNATSTKIEIPTHGISIDTNGIWMR